METKSKSKSRCGSKIYKNISVPEKAKIHLSKSNREFYISGINENKVSVRYIDTGEFTEVSYEIMKKYL